MEVFLLFFIIYYIQKPNSEIILYTIFADMCRVYYRTKYIIYYILMTFRM